MIRVHNLSFDYMLFNTSGQMLRNVFKNKAEYFRALHNVSFDVKAGEVVALIGANGSGKSTLLKVLTGVLTNYRGKVEVKGNISAILEVATSFAPEMTGRQNIYRHLLFQGYLTRQIAQLEEEIIEFSELEDVIDQKVFTYSSGMQAKLAFSVITSSVNDVLLIDELLVIGDEHFQSKSFKRIAELCSSGRTIVIASHNLSFIERLCERAIWIDKGKIKRIGPAHDVCMAYYGQNAEEVESSYPKEFGYIESVTVESEKRKLNVKSTIIRKKPTPDMHYQIAVHDNSTGILVGLMNTSWQNLRLPSGKGSLEITVKMQLPEKLHYGIVGTVLVHGSGKIPGSIVQDSWGWDNRKHISFSLNHNKNINGYIRIPMKWVKC